ncbi:MAG: hypothetical protein ACRDIL_04185, partial [Candidatus Limnocylindrales bacterium]
MTFPDGCAVGPLLAGASGLPDGAGLRDGEAVVDAVGTGDPVTGEAVAPGVGRPPVGAGPPSVWVGVGV